MRLHHNIFHRICTELLFSDFVSNPSVVLSSCVDQYTANELRCVRSIFHLYFYVSTTYPYVFSNAYIRTSMKKLEEKRWIWSHLCFRENGCKVLDVFPCNFIPVIPLPRTTIFVYIWLTLVPTWVPVTCICIWIWTNRYVTQLAYILCAFKYYNHFIFYGRKHEK